MILMAQISYSYINPVMVIITTINIPKVCALTYTYYLSLSPLFTHPNSANVLSSQEREETTT